MTETADLDAVVLERRLTAPAALVWRMWTEPDHFAAWYGPDGASITIEEMDVRVGGRRRVAMEMATPNGPVRMWFVGEFREVTPHERLASSESMADADGNVLTPEAAGMPPGLPAETEVRVDLAESEGVTTLTVTHAGLPAGSPGAAGWSMALAKLESRIAGAAAA